MYKIPNNTKQFKADNFSMTRGNVFSTFNVMFDADMGRIKLNPKMELYYSEADNADFLYPFAIVNATTDGGTQSDTYVLTTNGGAIGYVFSTLTGLAKITASDAPSKATDETSDMCLYLGSNDTEWLHVSDADGLHYVDPALSESTWSIKTNADFKNKFILIPFIRTNRLYMFTTSSVHSWDGISSTPETSGAYTQVNGLSNITCARASSERIWYATSGITGTGKSKVYEWDGVNVNPLKIYTLDTDAILSMSILGDIPHLMDRRGRMWVYNGYEFVIKDTLPFREDDTSNATVSIHRNGMITEKGKIYILVGSASSNLNTTERSLSGIWCYDPNIGLYHYTSPENMTLIIQPLALSRGRSDKLFTCGYIGSTTSTSGSTYRIAKTSNNAGITDDSVRIGHFITPFLESSELLNEFNTVSIKFREIFDQNASFEIKQRHFKGVEAYATVTWTSATTFTVTSSAIDGTGSTYCTPVEIGDEIMIQRGANTGLIAHIADMSTISGTTTVTIDRSATLTSGTAIAMFTNFKKLGTVGINDLQNFKSFRLAKSKTMIQIKIVMSWRGYYDEVQEIQVSNEVKQKQT